MILTVASGALAKPDDARSLADAAQIALTLRRADCRTRAETFCDADVMVDGYEATYRRMLDSDAPYDVGFTGKTRAFLPEAV